MKEDIVYLIHFEQEYKGCRHYIGYTSNLEERLERHRNNTGAGLLKALNQSGIRWDVVRTWPGCDREWERTLRKQKHSKRFCPICNPYNYWNHKNNIKE